MCRLRYFVYVCASCEYIFLYLSLPVYVYTYSARACVFAGEHRACFTMAVTRDIRHYVFHCGHERETQLNSDQIMAREKKRKNNSKRANDFSLSKLVRQAPGVVSGESS